MNTLSSLKHFGRVAKLVRKKLNKYGNRIFSCKTIGSVPHGRNINSNRYKFYHR